MNKMANSEDRLGWLVLATVILGTFLGSIDRTVVNLALPDIMSAFSITVSTAGWIVTAYILANAVFVPVWGKLGDTIGSKKVYIIGLGIFIGGSLLAGLAWSFSSLLVFRVIQALAVSSNYPAAMAIIVATFRDAKKRAQALGIWSASLASGAVLGPLIGGPLTDIFGWRSIFFLNLPLGLIGILTAVLFITETSVKKGKIEFDIWGAVILGVALSTLVLVLDRGQTWGWLSLSSFICYFATIIFLVWFYFVEKNHKEPLVDFKFFKDRNFLLILLNTFVVFMGMMGSVFLIPIFAETFLGYTATQTGYMFVPMAAVMMIASVIGAKLGNKISPAKIIGWGTFIAGGGLMLFTFLDPRSTAINIIIPLSVMSFGLALGMSHRPNIIAMSAPEGEVGVASSIFVLVRNVAGAFGVAIFATILNSRIESNVLNIARNTVINSKLPSVFQQVAALIILKAQVLAYAHVFVVSSIFVFVGGFFAFFIKVKAKGKKKKAEVMPE